MLGTDNVRLADFCFEIGDFQHLLRLLGKRNIAHLGFTNPWLRTLLNFHLETKEIYLEIL